MPFIPSRDVSPMTSRETPHHAPMTSYARPPWPRGSPPSWNPMKNRHGLLRRRRQRGSHHGRRDHPRPATPLPRVTRSCSHATVWVGFRFYRSRYSRYFFSGLRGSRTYLVGSSSGSVGFSRSGFHHKRLGFLGFCDSSLRPSFHYYSGNCFRGSRRGAAGGHRNGICGRRGGHFFTPCSGPS